MKSMWPARDGLQYGGAHFEAASRALLTSDERSAALGRPGALVMSDPRGAAELARVLTGLPRIPVVLTSSPLGEAIREYLQVRRRGIPMNRIAQGVLALPSSRERYLSGRSRQALRTNLTHAELLGIRCIQISAPATLKRMLNAWAVRRTGDKAVREDVEEWIAQEPACADWWLAVDHEDLPLAFAAITIDVNWALIHNLVSVSHPARWSLHTQLVSAAIESGAGQIQAAVPSALRLDPGSRHFQRLLGYGIANLRLKRPGLSASLRLVEANGSASKPRPS